MEDRDTTTPTRRGKPRHSPRLSRGGTDCTHPWWNRDTQRPQKASPTGMQVRALPDAPTPHVPTAAPTTACARDAPPPTHGRVGGHRLLRAGGGRHGPRQAPMPRARVHRAMPTRRIPMPRAHQAARQGTRHHRTARVRHQSPTPTPCPLPHRPGRAGHLLAVRTTHRARRSMGPRPRRRRPNDHART